MTVGHATHSIEQDSAGAPALCMRLSAISAAAVIIAFVAVALVTQEWAWLVVPAAVMFMAGVQGLLLLIVPSLRGKTACETEGCGDAR